ncbi:MAG: c-type cytochrome [Bacteroidota bacterium]
MFTLFFTIRLAIVRIMIYNIVSNDKADFMIHKKKMTTLFVLTVFVLVGAAASLPRKKERNLQVLPKDISDQMLDSIMQTYNNALGVTCNFCHSPAKATTPFKPAGDHLDFALDNGMKETARHMMRLTIAINKTYFYYDTASRPEYLKVITCKTCHRGQPFPIEN